MKFFAHILPTGFKRLIATVLLSLSIFASAFGQSTFTGTGNWSTPANWSAGVPTSATAATIASGASCTIDVAASCASLTFAAAAANITITLSGTNSLTVTGLVSMSRPSNGFICTIAVGAGTLTCGSLTMAATTSPRNDIITISTGTLDIAGTITTGTTGSQFTFTGAGTMNIGGSFTSTPALTTFTGSTVNYDGATQTARVATYYNLTISGSGVKTFVTTPTVNGILSMEGTATITSTTGVVTYGPAATLQYNTASPRTATLEEWITPFAATGGVIIANTGLITANAAKVFNASVPLTINSGASLSTGNFQVTFGGNFINNGGTFTAGSSPIVIANTMATQSIAGFTTTGLVSMTKTGGIATFTGNVNGAGLTINGSGGTLNLGTSLNHTFTGVVTLTAGTLNGGSSTLHENATSTTAWNGTGTVFSAGTGTVDFGGAAQTISATATTFNNLTMSGSGIKTIGGTVTVATDLTVGANTTLTVTGTGNIQINTGNLILNGLLDNSGTINIGL